MKDDSALAQSYGGCKRHNLKNQPYATSLRIASSHLEPERFSLKPLVTIPKAKARSVRRWPVDPVV